MDDLHNSQILIVDDIPENLQILSNILYDCGLEISFATDGKMALESIAYNKPDLILLDVAMPEMDGFEVCRKLKTDEHTKDIAIIFLTARSQIEDIVKGFELGAVDYITKPFNSSELVSRVSTHLELKWSRDLIQKQNRELQMLNATKDKFFSIIAHDLKNPFNSMLGFTEMLMDNIEKYDTAKIKHFVEMIFISARKGYNLLTNLLDWARTQSGKITCTPEKLDFGLLTNNALEVLTHSANAKNINLVVEIESGLFIYADKNMILSTIRNLVSNAIKFTPKNGTVKISASKINRKIDTKESVDMVEVKIADTGVGINPDELHKLFRIDAHLSTRGTENEEGTGLGLILCKEFIDKNKGEIGVQSTVGEGSTFIFTIPAVKKI